MKKNFLALGTCAFALALGLVACDDSTSANGSSGDENPAEVSSSSILTTSSPTEDPGSSSSSVILSDSEGSSSSVTSSSSVESSSSVASSSSEKSSSSVASSSSVKSSSSVASSSSAKSSSSSVVSSSSSSSAPTEDPSDSKLAWQYLNPDIDYGEFTDTRDGQVYKTVTIGTQTWMAENLNYETGNSWCYDNLASNCEKYGRLYTWSAVMDSAAQFSVNAGTKCGYEKTCTPNSPHRGICPEGWHVPTNVEYSALYDYIGGLSVAGSLLKSTTGWNNSGNGSDKYGFSVLSAGIRDYSGNFYDEGLYASLWSASEIHSYYVWYQFFRYDYDLTYQYDNSKYIGLSLRCLKD